MRLKPTASSARAQRWRFRHFFVDEFQDVNPAQFALLKAWLGTSTDLCVVGDPRQAIYSWNGADAQYMNDFEQHFPGAATVELRYNYRSSPQVLAAAHRVLRGASVLADTIATRDEGPIPTVTSHADDNAEALAIARRVRDQHGPGRRWSSQAVLVRTNGQIPLLEEACRRAGIPFRTRGGNLLRMPEARELLRRFERVARPLGELLEDLASDVVIDIRGDSGTPQDAVSVAEQVGDDDRTGLTDTVIAPRLRDTRSEIVGIILRLGRDYLTLEPAATGGSFVEYLRATNSNDDLSADADAVDIATFHAAKGLEWHTVHVAGLEQGLVPIAYAQQAEAQAEEQRLFYVALTRAETNLFLTWARERNFGTRVSARQPSPYLLQVEEADGRGSASIPVDHRRRAAEQRELLQRDRSITPQTGGRNSDPLMKALRSWRASTALAADVPAFVIFNDETLAAIAAARPKSRAALGRRRWRRPGEARPSRRRSARDRRQFVILTVALDASSTVPATSRCRRW